jgi:hypothetical protein
MNPFNRSRAAFRRVPRRGGRRGGRAARAVRSAVWPARRAAWAIEERLVWAGADAARSAVEDLTWPLERLAWTLRRHALRPLKEWFGAWGIVARSMFVLSLLWIGAVACLTGVRVADHADSSARSAPLARVDGHRTAVQSADARGAEPRAVLHGAAPTFAPAEHESANPAATARAATADSASVTASRSATVGVPSGRPAPVAALRVARRFAHAFVAYEVGTAGPAARLVFRETATPAVVRALTERPPRQPAGADVPEARVLNVVPGPRHGPNLSVSVSLLRLDATSELRLQMKRTSDGWLISDVRG